MIFTMLVYIIQNHINGHLYVGITSRTLQRRWSEHKNDCKKGKDRSLYRAMRKYGIENFSIRAVDTADCWEDLCKKEMKLLKSVHAAYNMTTGGDGKRGYKLSESTKEKLRAAHLGKTLSKEHREKLSEAKKGKRRSPRTEEHSKRISEGLLRAWKRRKDNGSLLQ